ncbi:MAG: hypothetical protein KC493_17540 [Bacteriovoracaceae bacterium]|nr:hypothetical protein [Bacteriovoracaceae bacterium]
MEELKMVDISNSANVKKILKDLFKSKKSLRIWQSIDETRNYCYGTIVKFSQMNESIEMCATDKEQFSFDENINLYFHSHFKDTLFKTTITDNGPDKIIIKRPSFVKIRDVRTEERKSFGLQSYQSANLQITAKINSKVKIVDSSSTGIGLIVNKYLFDKLNEGDIITITDSTLPEFKNRTAVVRNLGTMDKMLNNQLLFRCGLEILS